MELEFGKFLHERETENARSEPGHPKHGSWFFVKLPSQDGKREGSSRPFVDLAVTLKSRMRDRSFRQFFFMGLSLVLMVAFQNCTPHHASLKPAPTETSATSARP